MFNDASILRLITAVVVETHDEWHVIERRYLSEDSMAKLLTPAEPTYTTLRDSIGVAMSGNNPSEPLRPFLSGRG